MPQPSRCLELREPGGQHYAVIVDQFEEIITAHSERWQEREGFFRQLNQAMLDDPNLWVVLTLREDYVAALDPYAPLVADRLRARFYMERMGVAGALEAVRRPAELEALGDRRRPFAPGVAEQLVDNLRQMRVPGQQSTVPGPNVEPVQLQVVCYQLWENLAGGTGGTQITLDDLAQAGDVDRALTQYYEDTIRGGAGRSGSRRCERAAVANLVRRTGHYRGRHAGAGASRRRRNRRPAKRRGR